MRALDEDDAQARLVFAEYGFAAFSAQKLENGLLVVLQLANVHARVFQTRAEALASIEKNGVVSMGALLAQLMPIIEDSELLDELREALVRRNWLVHHFFREHQNDEMTMAGTNLMVSDCRQAAALFQSASARLGDVMLLHLDAISEHPDAYLPGLADEVDRLMAERPEQAS